MDRVFKNDNAAADRIPVDHKRRLQKKTKCTCSEENISSFLSLYVLLLLIAMVLVPFFLQSFLPNASIPEGIMDKSNIANEKPLSFIDQIISWVPENPFNLRLKGLFAAGYIFNIIRFSHKPYWRRAKSSYYKLFQSRI